METLDNVNEMVAFCLSATKNGGAMTNINRQAMGVLVTVLGFSTSNGLQTWHHKQFGIPHQYLKEGKEMAARLKSGESTSWARQRRNVRSDITDPQHLDAANEHWLNKTRPSEVTGNTLHAPGTTKEWHVKHYLDSRMSDFYHDFVTSTNLRHDELGCRGTTAATTCR